MAVSCDTNTTHGIAWSRDKVQCTDHQVFADPSVSANASEHMHLGKERNQQEVPSRTTRDCACVSSTLKEHVLNSYVQVKHESVLLHFPCSDFCGVTARK